MAAVVDVINALYPLPEDWLNGLLREIASDGLNAVLHCGKPVDIILLAGRAKSDQPRYIRRGKKDVAAIGFCNVKP